MLAPVPDWTALSTERQCRAMFGLLVPQQGRHVMSATEAGVWAAIFEADLTNERNLVETARWLCIASEISPGRFSVQVSNKALATSDSFHPVDAVLRVGKDRTVEVSEQGTRSHTLHVWEESDGTWRLASREFAGVVAHEHVTEKFDLAAQELVVTLGEPDSDAGYFRQCFRADALVELGTYCNGQSVVV
jgi:hypothetical protein